jgi:hypothetical protein
MNDGRAKSAYAQRGRRAIRLAKDLSNLRCLFTTSTS